MKPLKRKSVGDRLNTTDWNTVVDFLNTLLKQVSVRFEGTSKGNFVGKCTEDVEPFSLLVVDGQSTPFTPVAPILTVKKPPNIHPLQLWTNGDTAIKADETGGVVAIGDVPVKVLCTGDDADYRVGLSCGPTKDTYTVQPFGFGLVACSKPFTENETKYIYVISSYNTLCDCKSPSGGVAAGASGTFTYKSIDGTVRTGVTFEAKNITDGTIASEANAICQMIDGEMRICVASCS